LRRQLNEFHALRVEDSDAGVTGQERGVMMTGHAQEVRAGYLLGTEQTFKQILDRPA
jgi:hypothetical protein